MHMFSINASCIGYAGTKDRRAKTAQEITLRRSVCFRRFCSNLVVGCEGFDII